MFLVREESILKNPLFLGLLVIFLMPSSLASAKSDNADAACFRKDVAAITRMAEAGYPLAQYTLGCMYDQGRGVRENNAAAVRWYAKAADQGHADAQNYLGGMYYNGRGVTQDYAAAFSWYRKAADQGLAEAQVSLGNMYAEGRGITQDYVQAYKWYRLSASSGGSARASNLVAKMTYAQLAEAQRLARAWVKK